MTGRFTPPLYFIYLAFIQWCALYMVYYWYGYQGPWIDRVLTLEIWAASTVTWMVMLFKTPDGQWTRRGIGIFGFMLGASVLSTISQAVEWGFMESPVPQWAINMYRSPLALGVPLILYGYIMYFRGMAWDDRPATPIGYTFPTAETNDTGDRNYRERIRERLRRSAQRVVR